MAQLKDLLVAGPSRLIGDVYTTNLQVNTLLAPSTSGGTTYGAGTNGQVLMSNGTSSYWGTLGSMATETATNYIPKSIGTTKGDIIYWSAASTPARLAIGTAGYFLKATTNGPAYSALTSSEVTTAFGNKNANQVFAGPSSGNAAAPSFRSLVAADIPNLSWSKITSDKPTTLSGYGITDAKIANGVITLGSNSITPLTAHQDISGKADKTATVSTVTWDSTNKKLTKTINGSTTDVVTAATLKTDLGLSSAMLFIGSLGTDGTATSLPTAAAANRGYTYKVITAGTYASTAAKVGDVFVSNGSEWVLIPSGDEPSGTVTSITINGTAPISVNSSSAITTSGTRTISLADAYGDTKNPYGNKTANYVLAGPASGSAAAPSFRALVAADIPGLAWSKITSGIPTTLAGYGITDATIASGTITLGTNTITPMTNIGLVTGESTAANNGITKTVGTTTSVAITQADLQSAIFIISDTAPADTSVIWLKPVSE